MVNKANDKKEGECGINYKVRDGELILGKETWEAKRCTLKKSHKASFEHVDRFYQLILQVKDRESFPMILVANKVDLMHLIKIIQDQGKEMVPKHNIPYIETSAKDPPLNVDKAFHDLVRVIRQQVPEKNQKKKKTKCPIAERDG
ncbi:Ras-related protein M-Ras, partial [Ophiophagus hannah]